MEAKHTPGPWMIAEQSDDGLSFHFWVSSAHRQIAGLWRHHNRNEKKNEIETDHANARLIAAAPDMLEALTKLLHETDGGAQPCAKQFADAARAAIAKAEGRGNFGK